MVVVRYRIRRVGWYVEGKLRLNRCIREFCGLKDCMDSISHEDTYMYDAGDSKDLVSRNYKWLKIIYMDGSYDVLRYNSTMPN